MIVVHLCVFFVSIFILPFIYSSFHFCVLLYSIVIVALFILSANDAPLPFWNENTMYVLLYQNFIALMLIIVVMRGILVHRTFNHMIEIW